MLAASLLGLALAMNPPVHSPAGFAPELDQATKAPDTRAEDAQRLLDLGALEPSARSEFQGAAPAQFVRGPWVVRARYQSTEQLNLLVRRAAPWRVYPEGKTVILEVANLFEFDQLNREGFWVQLDVARTNELQAALDPQRSIVGFACYRTVEETYATAESLVAQKPAIAEWLDIGDSQLKQLGQGGYDLRALHISNRSIPGPKPVLMLQGAIHAREYATAESVTRFAEQLVQGYGVNADITWMIDHHDIYLVLVANPDGRKLAEVAATQFTRKNRNPAFICNSDNAQTGVDLNRNYPFDFGGPGTSTTICNQTFRGPSAISEAESIALTNFARSIFPDQRAETSVVPPDQTTTVSLDASGVYIDVHSNGGGIWYPWGNTTAGSAPNATQLRQLARKIGFISGLPGNRSSDFGAIGGATDDWTFGTLGVAAFTMELGGSSFFPNCTTYEASIGPPAVASFFMAARTARAPYRLAGGPDVLNLAVTYNAGNAVITASANDTRFNPTESGQTITGVELYNVPPWTAGATAIASFSASDGSFSSTVENITVTISGANLPTSFNQIYYAQATDASGNRGPVSAVFLSPVGDFRNGFE